MMPDYNTNSPYWYGLRHGSNKPKASGFFGELSVPGTKDLATEYSSDVEINGKNVQIPTITPNLKANQLARLLTSMGSGSDIPEDVMSAAIQNARYRMAMGQSPFWRIPEKVQPQPSPSALDTEQISNNYLADLLRNYR